jgi:hypothetical protein
VTNHSHTGGVAGLIAVLVAALMFVPASSARQAVWTETTPQMFFPGFGSVGASSTTNVWAVGENDADREQPVAERWTGSRWVLHFGVLPNPTGAPDGGFDGVTVLTATDVWAVGWMDMGNSNSHGPLAERWNGTVWKIIALPSAAAGGTLNAVSAVSRTDVWAVGSAASGGPLVMRWNGTSWRLVAAPGATAFSSVKAVSASNVWGVGGNVVEHYNGSNWTRVPVPLASTITLNQINRVPGTTHLWAVGWNTDTAGNETPVAIYYNGSAWSRNTPPIATGRLGGVAANSDSDVWVSGVDWRTQVNVTAHWNGSTWTVGAPAGLANGSVENMTHAPNSNQLFAVGSGLGGDGPFAAYYH